MTTHTVQSELATGLHEQDYTSMLSITRIKTARSIVLLTLGGFMLFQCTLISPADSPSVVSADGSANGSNSGSSDGSVRDAAAMGTGGNLRDGAVSGPMDAMIVGDAATHNSDTDASDAAGSGYRDADASPAGDGASCPLAGAIISPNTGLCACPPTLPDECSFDGACVDFQTDPSHCGNCITACSATAACLEGQCTTAPAKLIGLVSPCANVRVVMSTAGYLLFTFSDAGTVSSLPAAGGAPSQIATAQAQPGPIVGTTTRVFWIDQGDGTLRVDPPGTNSLVAGASDALAATSAGLTVFYNVGSIIYQANYIGGDAGFNPDGGASLTDWEHDVYVAQPWPGGNIKTMAAFSNHLAFTSDSATGRVGSCATDGSSCVDLGTSQTNLLSDVVVLDSTDAYWAAGDHIQRAPLTGGSSVTVVSAPEGSNITGFATAAGHVYFASGGTIYRGDPSTPGATPESVARAQTGAHWLVSNGQAIFWLTDNCDVMTQSTL